MTIKEIITFIYNNVKHLDRKTVEYIFENVLDYFYPGDEHKSFVEEE